MEKILTIIGILFFAMVIHEYAHAWAANKLGDPTARLAGRMTLNPLKHIDPFGTLLLPALLTVLSFLGSPFFPVALAKPVPVNFLRLHNPRRDMILVGMAGPAVNVALAVLLGALLKFSFSDGVLTWLGMAVFINLVLAVFNMVPIPPLDGSRLVMGLLPPSFAAVYSRLEPYGIFIVFALLPMGLFDKIVMPITVSLSQFLGVYSL